MRTSSRRIVLFSLALAFASVISPLTAVAQAVPTVTVPDHCTATDMSGTAHVYAGQFLGICALVAAKEQGAVGSYQLLYDDAFGLYVQTLGGTAPSATEYWALYKNNTYADDGLSTMAVTRGDRMTFQLTDWTDNSTVGAPVVFNIDLLVSAPIALAPPGGGLTLRDPFDVPRALAFITSAQHADGSFDTPLLADWVAIAFAGGGAGDAQKKLAQYFIAHPPAGGSVPDYERHAMALEALGINPYSGTPVDYITPIVQAFDGTQIGDIALINDDVFALFPLLHAGYTDEDPVIRKTVEFILSKQGADGAWENSIDMTAAAVQALSPVRRLPGVASAITSGANYLNTQEKADGSFGNSFTTSWVLQSIATLPDSQLDWYKGHFSPQYYLATLQGQDGGVEPVTTDKNTRVWATAYAIPAVERKTWDSLLSSFPRPVTSTTEAQSPATTTVTVHVPQTEETYTPQTLPDVTLKTPIAEEPHIQAPETATQALATTTPDISARDAQTAAVATADGGTANPWKWATALLSVTTLALLGFQTRLRYQRTQK